MLRKLIQIEKVLIWIGNDFVSIVRKRVSTLRKIQQIKKEKLLHNSSLFNFTSVAFSSWIKQGKISVCLIKRSRFAKGFPECLTSLI